jgi:hypothetical protein
MDKPSKFALLNHGVGFDRDTRSSAAWSGGRCSAGSPRTTVNLSKAERLLGVSDTSGMNAQVSRPGSDASKRSQRRGKGFTSAFSDLKGAFSGARYAPNRGRHTPNSSGHPGPTDSDSMTSMTSPTFDTSTSASTLPSHFDAPNSPYFSHRGSESPSSPQDADARFDYHAALSPERYKAVKDLRYINEQLMRPADDSIRNQPPLEMPPLSPVSKPETPKTPASFAPINRLRSPSNISVASEVTAKARLFGRRNSKHMSKETYLDYPSTPSTENQTPVAHVPIPPMPTTKADTVAIEQWLARADLARRASTTSTATRSTAHRKEPASAFSATSSSVSVRTMTTHRSGPPPPSSPPPPVPPILRNVRSSDELDNFAVARQQPGFRQGTDLSIQSVLSLSSSEDESSDDEQVKKPRAGRADKSTRKPEAVAFPLQRNGSQSSATTAPQILEMQRQAIIQKRAQKRGSKRHLQPIVPPPLPDINKTVFGSVDWPNPDDDMLLIEGEESIAQPSGGNGTRNGNRKTDSMTVSPTSKVMVVSKKEEKLLAQMRESKRVSDRISVAESEAKSESPSSAPATPIISVSPPRRPKRTKTPNGVEEMLELSENRVITFPTPPKLPMIGSDRGRSGSMSLSLSREVMSELSGSSLPEMVGESSNPPPLPTGVALSADAASHVSGPFSVSELSPSIADSRQNFFDSPSTTTAPQELQGSFPDLTSALRADIKKKREKRRTSGMFFTTDLENRHGDEWDIELEDDVARFVMSSVI